MFLYKKRVYPLYLGTRLLVLASSWPGSPLQMIHSIHPSMYKEYFTIKKTFRYLYELHRKIQFGDLNGESMWKAVEEIKELPGVHVDYTRYGDRFCIGVVNDFMLRIHRVYFNL